MTREAQAALSCSKTLRRLAHQAKREALGWEAAGNLKHYRECRAESDRLWNRARWQLQFARRLA